MRLRTIQVVVLSLLVIGVSQSAEAQRRGGRGFGRGPFTPSLNDTAVRLASDEAVQKEIKADEDQVKKLADLAEEIAEARGAAFGNFRGFRDLSEEERDKRLAEAREKMAKASAEEVKKAQAILKPEQFQRLKEIAFQVVTQRGTSSVFQIDEFVKAAKVTDEQKEKVQKLNGELRAEAEKVSDNRREQFAWLREEGAKKYEPKFAAILTDEQNAVVKKMKGAEFDVSKIQFGRGRGGRPGGGRRPQRPNSDQ